jgi:hypothetical protein
MAITKILLYLCLFIACKGKETKKEPIMNNTQVLSEDFNSFISRFSKNKEFQKNRIKFPLKNKQLDIETNEYFIQTIQKKDWIYFDMSAKKFIKKVQKMNEKYVIIIQLEGTGVNVSYFFEKNKNLWYLTSIVDEST